MPAITFRVVSKDDPSVGGIDNHLPRLRHLSRPAKIPLLACCEDGTIVIAQCTCIAIVYIMFVKPTYSPTPVPSQATTPKTPTTP